MPEYPGYSVYAKGTDCNEDQVSKDADSVFKYLTDCMKINPKNIILLGRSIGSGPATYLASKHEVLSLILISPFKSIKAVGKFFDRLKIVSE
jgi:dienelactone hydrolase